LTSAFGHDQKLAYSPYVRPLNVRGVKAVIVRHELASLEPRLYQFLVNFAQDNELLTSFEVDARSVPQSLVPPTGPGGSPAGGGEPSESV